MDSEPETSELSAVPHTQSGHVEYKNMTLCK